MLFKLAKDGLKQISQKKFSSEKDEIQEVIGNEKNLKEIFGLEFVKNEFQLKNLRIDTLAFNQETNSFVIIEYKRERNISVIDQGYSYLSLMLENKADFILEYNEKKNVSLKRNNVDWSQSRVLFLSPEFTNYQKKAANFKDLPIELWVIKRYDDNLIYVDQIIPQATASIGALKKTKQIEDVRKEIKVYSIEDHLKGKPNKIKNTFDTLRNRILEIDGNIIEKPVKFYIGYKLGNRNFIGVHIYKSKIVIHLVGIEKKELKDPQEIVEDIPESYGWGVQSRFSIKPGGDIEYAIFLIKQAYDKLRG